mgnify:FL=1
MSYGKTQQGDRNDNAFLRRKENDRKSMEMTNKKIHKTRKCKCCEGEHKM